MDNNQQNLSHKDIESLMHNPSPEVKISVIEKLSNQYNSKRFTEAQIALAEQIFRLLLRQAEIEVRKALSENLMHSPMVPHDVVLSLAKDVEEVATPVLEFSQVLSESDLVDIIKSTEKVTAHMAISRRGSISEDVAAALIDTKNEEVVNSLVQNEGAKISNDSYNKIITNFSGSESIVDAMVTRGSIPPMIIEQLTSKVSEVIKNQLEHKYKKSFKDINYFFRESGEIATLKFMGKQKIDKELLDLVDDLEKSGELTEYLDPVNGRLTQLLDGLEEIGTLTPFAALTVGHLTLFEICMCRLGGVPFTNVKKLVMDHQGGLRALYEKVGLPMKLFDAVQFIIVVIKSMEKAAELNNTPKAHKNLFVFLKNITTMSKGKNIPYVAHFVSIITQHAEATLSEW